MAPLISILLPTKNPGRFLPERLNSIFAQSVSDWELIIVDSQSTDGSLAVLENLARQDKRVSFYECPPGLYGAWNFAVRHARGKYVYFATADDTMRPETLQKMSAALEAHKECDYCDSKLQLIDAGGREIREFGEGYVSHCRHLAYPRDVAHVRKSPADFFAHLAGKTIYNSVNQLLIRRDFFEKTGLFPEDYGPCADYLWGMRAALYGNVIYLPEYLAGWRIHNSQATQGVYDYFLRTKMAQKVLQEAPPEYASIGKKTLRLSQFRESLLPAKKFRSSAIHKLLLLGRTFLHYPLLTLEFLGSLPFMLLYVPRKFVLIYAYDRMIYRHTKGFYRGKIAYCREN